MGLDVGGTGEGVEEGVGKDCGLEAGDGKKKGSEEMAGEGDGTGEGVEDGVEKDCGLEAGYRTGRVVVIQTQGGPQGGRSEISRKGDAVDGGQILDNHLYRSDGYCR